MTTMYTNSPLRATQGAGPSPQKYAGSSKTAGAVSERGSRDRTSAPDLRW